MENQWTLSEYSIKEESPIDGKLLLRILNELSQVFSNKYCIISMFDGGLDVSCDKDDLIGILDKNCSGVSHLYNSDEILGVIEKFLVVDWGDFYFFDSKPEIFDITFTSLNYEEIISKTVFSFRVWDSRNIQLFTRESSDKVNLDFMKLESVKCGALSSFDYPG